jgi:hypothetical protein
MKYEKYLLQVCKSMLHDWEVVQCCAGDCRSVTGNILEQMNVLDKSIWTMNYVATNCVENFKNALDVPKDFVENSKATTWFAILKNYKEKKSGSINSKNE